MITLEEIIKDIEEGKSKMIYFSANTLWWTHLDSDIEDSTKQARARMKLKHDQMMKSDMPKAKKEHAKLLYEMAMKNEGLPLDPSGSPLMQMKDPTKWITGPQKQVEHYGKHGIETFLLTHHQNCDDVCYTSWQDCNDAIDKKLKKEEKKKKN